MQQLLRVLAVLILAQSVAAAAAPVQAAGVVLVGCNLLSAGGPRVTFVQGPDISDGIGEFQPGAFVGISGFRSEDFIDRNCAEVLAGLSADGLAFQAMEVFGRDSAQALWFFRQD
jgi:hypothetical protein